MLATILIAFMGGVIGFFLGSENAQQNYVANVLLSFCAGLFVSLVFTFIIQKILSAQSAIELFQHRQIAATVNLYERFHSPEMIEMRCRVDRLLRKGFWRDKSLNEIHSQLYVNNDCLEQNKDWLALSSMIHFFENVADLHERGLIDSASAKENFKKYFRYLHEDENLREAIHKSLERGETWFFISRWEYLKQNAGF